MNHAKYDLISPRSNTELRREIHNTLDDLNDRVSPELSRGQAFLLVAEKELVELHYEESDYPAVARGLKALLKRIESGEFIAA